MTEKQLIEWLLTHSAKHITKANDASEFWNYDQGFADCCNTILEMLGH